jgi:hypothetical protein
VAQPAGLTLCRAQPTEASASISTSMSGLISRRPSTMLVAGRMSRNSSPRALPTFSHSSMFTTEMRVRTTSLRLAPAALSAASRLARVWTVCR